VSIKYEIPERCLFAQAAIYVVRGDVPIPDEIYLASPAQSVGWSDELIWALRAGRLHARGNLFNAIYIKEECRWAQSLLEEEDAEIDSAFWSRDQIDLQRSSLRVNRVAVEAKYEVARFVASYENDEESGPAETCYIFFDITIATKDLFEHFSVSAAQVTRERTPTQPSVETAESGKLLDQWPAISGSSESLMSCAPATPSPDEQRPTSVATTSAVEHSFSGDQVKPQLRLAEAKIEPEFKRWREQQPEGYLPTAAEDIAHMKQLGVGRDTVRELRKKFPTRERGQKKSG
jgi:hypothetical protein